MNNQNLKLINNLIDSSIRVVGGLGCVGKKTALLQAEASACVSGLANVQFCAWAVYFFLFLSLSSKLSVRFCLFTLTANGRGYETCRIAEMRLYPTIQNLMRDETLENPLKPACFMTRCWRFVVF